MMMMMMMMIGNHPLKGKETTFKKNKETTIFSYPKNPWTLQWKGLNLYGKGPGPQNSNF